MKFLGFEYSQADPDVWMRESVQKDGSTKYYEYVLLYTDDCLFISNGGENVPIESFQIFLTHAALHGVPVMAADVLNAYLQAPTSEKHFVICGPEFGIENIDKKAIITRDLYGGKVARRDFWHHL